MRTVLTLGLALLSSGCLVPGTAPVPVTPWSLAFDCGTSTYAPRAGVCARTLGTEGDTWAEPYVAAHPTQEGRFVVAVQGQGAGTGGPLDGVVGVAPDGLPVAETAQTSCLEWRLCLFLTQDGGLSWTRRAVADGLDQPVLDFDPVVAFTADGLLMAGLVRNGGGLAAARSTDDGATWSTTMVTARAGTDRPWLGLQGDEALLVWQTSGATEGFWSRSQDDGRTWSAPGGLPCNLHSRPVWREDGWRVACSQVDRTLVLRIAADGQVQTLERLPSTSGTLHLDERPDGSLWLGQPGSRPEAFLSPDAGATWRPPIDLAAAIPGGRWTRSWVPWIEARPDGSLLAFVVVSEGGCVLRCDVDSPLHLVHIGADGGFASAIQVAPGNGRPIASDAERAGGEFDGMACGPRTCLVAWMDQGLVDVAVLL